MFSVSITCIYMYLSIGCIKYEFVSDLWPRGISHGLTENLGRNLNFVVRPSSNATEIEDQETTDSPSPLPSGFLTRFPPDGTVVRTSCYFWEALYNKGDVILNKSLVPSHGLHARSAIAIQHHMKIIRRPFPNRSSLFEIRLST